MSRLRAKIKLILLVFLFLSCVEKKENRYSVIEGVYDASNLGLNEIVTLEGDWIFVPSSFVPPYEDFSKFKRYEHINVGWHTYEDGEDARGYATYAVRLKNLAPNEIYAIRTSSCSSAFTVYLNGEEVFNVGKVGKTKEEEEFKWDSSLIVLPTYSLKNAILVFHVSNFGDRYPGFSKPIKFGVYSAISTEKNRDTIIFVILAGYLFVAGAFFISLYLFYSKETKAFYFGLICLNFSLRICCYDEFLITTIVPHIDSIFLFKLGYITFSLSIVLVSLFVQELFGMTKKIILYLSFIPSLVYLLVNIFASTYISSVYLPYAQIYVFILGIYNIVLVIISTINKNRDAKLFLLGLSVFLILAIRDALIANRIIEGSFFAQLGVVILLIPMSIIVLRSFKLSYNRITSMTEDIDETNNALARFLPNEFLKLLNKKHVDIKLGDHILKEMYIAFIHMGLSENLDSREERFRVLKIYNNALYDINPIIKAHNGFIDKYLPEGIMLVFDSSAKDVIKCMLKIEELIGKENVARILSGKEKITFASAVHYGRLMIGTIGEERRMDSTVISDAVNVASRLHFYALQQKVSIFVSDVVKNNFEENNEEGYVEFYHKSKVQIRGKDETIDIYEVNKK